MKIIIKVITLILAASCFAQADRPAAGETDATVIAVVHGKKVTVAEKNELGRIILGTLLERFAVENKIEPTQEELDAFVLNIEKRDKQRHAEREADRNQKITDEEKEQMRIAMREIAHQVVKSWKINKALYEKFGGRVIFQQAGAEPLDAYRDFLKEQEKMGDFQILDKNYEDVFWQYFTNDAMHGFYKNEDGAKVMNTPWWINDEPREE